MKKLILQTDIEKLRGPSDSASVYNDPDYPRSGLDRKYCRIKFGDIQFGGRKVILRGHVFSHSQSNIAVIVK